MIGDRADLAPLQGRAWDAAIDTSGYDPAQVAASAALDVGHYVFVSSCNAYPDWPDKPVDEDSPTWTEGEGYGPEKAAAERHVLPDGAVVRAGLIVGPHDNVFRLPWWVRRIAEGGEVPAPGRGVPAAAGHRRPRPRRRGWCASPRSARAAPSTAPPRVGQTTMGELLQTAVDATGSDAALRWIPEAKLEEAGVAPWMELPLWLPARHLGTWDVGTERGAGRRAAHAAGRRDRRRHLEVAASGRRGRARRLALRTPPAER